MRVDLVSAVPGAAARLRIALLPGAHQEPEELRAAGFLAAVKERGLNVDIVLVAPQLEHVTDRSVLARLHNEVVLPARQSGTVALWFAGISMGGFLTLLYAAEHPADLEGLCLLAPYLGNRMIYTEIGRFDSLAHWHHDAPEARDELAEERRVWHYLASPPHGAALRYLGFGRDDRFAATQLLLARQLPAEAVDIIAGGHDGRVWRTLWDRFLDRITTIVPQLQ